MTSDYLPIEFYVTWKDGRRTAITLHLTAADARAIRAGGRIMFPVPFSESDGEPRYTQLDLVPGGREFMEVSPT